MQKDKALLKLKAQEFMSKYPAAIDKMAAFDAERSNHFKQLYREQDGALYPRRNQKLFMITSNLEIARSDCLWYAALAE
jgi:hypothetical protein